MTVLIGYRASVTDFPDGGRGIILERGVDADGRNQSHIIVTMIPEEAKRLASCIRLGADGWFEGIEGTDSRVIVGGEEYYTICWNSGQDDAVEIIGGSEWIGPFMDEVQRVAEEAME